MGFKRVQCSLQYKACHTHRALRTLATESLPFYAQAAASGIKKVEMEDLLTEDMRVDMRASLSCLEGSKTPI